MEPTIENYSSLPFTERLYNSEPYTNRATAKVLFIEGNVVIFDRTIFYAESGGQIYDLGYIALEGTETNYQVINVQHRQGRKPIKKDREIQIPDIEVETKILHYFQDLVDFKVGDSVVMNIDWDRRYQIMKNHSLAHFLFHAIKSVYSKNNYNLTIRGCSIDEYKASFSLDRKFSSEEWEEIKKITLETIYRKDEIKMEKDPEYETVFYWKYGDIIIPCGGTHVYHTEEIIEGIYFGKKNAGKESSRIYISSKELQ